jgi:hypothetical protein
VKHLEDLSHIFLVLNDKGEKYRLKLEGSTQFVLVSVMSGKTGLPSFSQQNFYLSFLFPNFSRLENYVICERLCVKACNTYLNLNYACFLCHVILYLIHVNFMQICILECLKCNDEYFLVNMLSLENRRFRFYKSNVPVLLVLPGKTG